MNATAIEPDHPASLALEYQLTEADVHHYCVSSRPRKCWLSCRRRKAAWLILTVLGLFLVGICYQRQGLRAGSLALGVSLVALTALAWSRQAWADHNVCRLARQMGLPCNLHLIISSEGILERPEADEMDPGRAFAWSEVVGVSHIDALTVIRFRPAGGVLIVPDRTFSSPETRSGFGEFVSHCLEAELHQSNQDL